MTPPHRQTTPVSLTPTYPPPAEWTHDFGSILRFTELNFSNQGLTLPYIAPQTPVKYTYADENTLDTGPQGLWTPLWDFFLGPQRDFTPINPINSLDTKLLQQLLLPERSTPNWAGNRRPERLIRTAAVGHGDNDSGPAVALASSAILRGSREKVSGYSSSTGPLGPEKAVLSEGQAFRAPIPRPSLGRSGPLLRFGAARRSGQQV